MPLTHFACPPNKKQHGEAHTPEFCIKECKERCLSPFFIAWLAQSNRRNYHVGRLISVTSLKGCVRKLKLERTTDYADYMENCYYAARGTLIHGLVEQAADFRFDDGGDLKSWMYLMEWRMKLGFCFRHGAFTVPQDLDPARPETWAGIECPRCVRHRVKPENREWFILTGTLDGTEPLVLDVDGTLWCVLHDVKTVQDYAADRMIWGDPDATLHSHFRDEHVVQMNLYKYMAERSCPPPELVDRGVKQIRFTHARIQGFSMGKAPYAGGTIKARKTFKQPYQYPEIPVINFFDDVWAEELVRKNARPIYEALILDEGRGPICEPAGNKPDEHSWACRFCAFHQTALCPNPKKEWELLQEGEEPEEAFQKALVLTGLESIAEMDNKK